MSGPGGKSRCGPEVSPGTSPHGYWCELVARSPEARDEWYLDGGWCPTVPAAFNWLGNRAGQLARTLDAPASTVFGEWLADTAYQAVQRNALTRGCPISTNAGTIDRVIRGRSLFVFYSLTCRPLILAPLHACRHDQPPASAESTPRTENR